MDLSGLNQFGSLTTQSGKRLTFEDFDLNKDGKITDAEFNRALSNWGLDSLELSSIDQNKDNIITEEEFANFELEAEINQVLNDFINTTVSSDTDLIGSNLKYGQQVTSELKAWVDEFKAQYTGDSEQMIADLKAQLPGKFNQIKAEILANTPEKVQSRVINEMIDHLITELSEQSDTIDSVMSNEIIQTLGKKLETLSAKFVASYTGSNLEADLKEYLNEALNSSPSEKMAEAIDKLNEGVHSDTGYIDSFEELPLYKEQVKEFLMAAINSGLTLRMNNVNIVSESSIDSLLAKYSDGASLQKDLNELINSLSDTSLKETIINDALESEALEQEKAFQSLTGEDVKIDTSTSGIDYSKIPGYYENSTVTIKGQGVDGAKDEAMNVLNGLKEQLKKQLAETLEAKGIPFEKIEAIFEKVFTQSAQEAVNSCVSGQKQIRFLWITWRKSSSSFNTKDLVDTFLTKFNESLASTIDTMNETNTDLDIQNIDFTLAATDENGNVDEVLDEMLTNGGTKAINLYTDEPADKIAGTMIDRLKGTLLAKSKAMCEANGIEFDNDKFDTIFENSKGYAISVTSEQFLWMSYINPKECINTFLTSFKSSYEAMIETEKQKV